MAVRIRYRRSGGFAGIELAADASSDELPSDQADLARALLANPPGPSASPGPTGADRFTYELDLDDGTHQQTFHWTDADVPDQARPLLSALNRLAQPG